MRTDYPDGSSEHFSYDHAGRLSVLTDAEGNRTAYDYDNDNKPTVRYARLAVFSVFVSILEVLGKRGSCLNGG